MGLGPAGEAGYRGDLLEHELRRARAAGREGERATRSRAELESRVIEPLGLERDDVRDRREDGRRRTHVDISPARGRSFDVTEGQPDALLGRRATSSRPRPTSRRFYRALLDGEVGLRPVARGDEGVRRGASNGIGPRSRAHPSRGSSVQRLVRPRRVACPATTGAVRNLDSGRQVVLLMNSIASRRHAWEPGGPGGRRRADERRPLSLIPFHQCQSKKRRKNHDNHRHTRAADHNTATGRP